MQLPQRRCRQDWECVIHCTRNQPRVVSIAACGRFQQMWGAREPHEHLQNSKTINTKHKSLHVQICFLAWCLFSASCCVKATCAGFCLLYKLDRGKHPLVVEKLYKSEICACSETIFLVLAPLNYSPSTEWRAATSRGLFWRNPEPYCVDLQLREKQPLHLTWECVSAVLANKQ